MPKYTHKERPISEPIRSNIRELVTTGKLPSDDKDKKETLDFVKEYTIEQGELYTETFEGLTFAEQAKSLSAVLYLYLRQAIRAHAERAEKEQHDPKEIFKKCIKSIEELPAKLKADPDLQKYV